ncbi:MAG: helix-turn-helix transcriptional regulator [Caldilineaceae bacterium]|nr:helix-turn-helix transcriptional regulator [Caldilineaceae bacterium]
MNRKHFGQLIAALRNEQFDPIVGRSWTQKTLAERTGLTERIVGEIERGQRVNLDAETLLALAKAFRLNTLERREFFAAVVEIEDKDVGVNKYAASEILQELLETLLSIRLPALIHDPFFDLVAMNSLYRKFHSLLTDVLDKHESDTLPTKNYLSLFFGNGTSFKQVAPQQWRQYVLRNLLQFRYTTLRYRHTGYYQTLFKTLYSDFSFRELWSQCLYIVDDTYSQVKTNNYYHHRHGQVNYAMTLTSTLTPYGYLYLSVLVPKNENTAQVIADLVNGHTLTIEKLSPWPNPAVYDPQVAV